MRPPLSTRWWCLSVAVRATTSCVVCNQSRGVGVCQQVEGLLRSDQPSGELNQRPLSSGTSATGQVDWQSLRQNSVECFGGKDPLGSYSNCSRNLAVCETPSCVDGMQSQNLGDFGWGKGCSGLQRVACSFRIHASAFAA
jgi:hypothetical protein